MGALEDGDEDEDNVYGTETLTSYDSTLAAEGDLNMERKFGWTGSLQTGEGETQISPSPSPSLLALALALAIALSLALALVLV